MNPKKRRLVPNAALPAAMAGILPLLGCIPDPEATSAVAAPPMSASRAAAVADMRAKAEFAALAPYPSTAAPSSAHFAYPRSVEEVAAQQAELELLAARRRGALVTSAELARLEARAAELRRLARAAKAGQ